MAVYRTLAKGQEAPVTIQAIPCARDTSRAVYDAVHVAFLQAVAAQARSFVGRFRQHLSKQLWLNLCFCVWWVWSAVDNSGDIDMGSFALRSMLRFYHILSRSCSYTSSHSLRCCLMCPTPNLQLFWAVALSNKVRFYSQHPQPLWGVVGHGG